MDTLQEMLQNFTPEPEGPSTDIYESDKFPPKFQAGQKVRFLFSLEDEPFKLASDNKVIVVSYRAEAMQKFDKVTKAWLPVASNSSGNQPTLRFQRADSRTGQYKGRTIPSRLHNLYRGLVGRERAKETGTDPRLITNALLPLSGQATFDGTIGWRYFDKDSGVEYSTEHKKEKSYTNRQGNVIVQKPWPMVDGMPARTVDGEFPQDFILTVLDKK